MRCVGSFAREATDSTFLRVVCADSQPALARLRALVSHHIKALAAPIPFASIFVFVRASVAAQIPANDCDVAGSRTLRLPRG
jgi:hypothetical protein